MKCKIVVLLIILIAVFTSPVLAEQSQDPYFNVIYSYIAYNSSQDQATCAWIAHAIIYYCSQYNVDPILVTAMFKQESHFNMQANSNMGAIGIAQIMPETANALGIDPYNPVENIEGGIRYLSQQLNNFSNKGQWATTYALAAYNAGPGSISSTGQLPGYQETYNYVVNIFNNYTEIAAMYKK